MRRVGLDRFELTVLFAFAAISVWVLALDLSQIVEHGRVWTGTDGEFLTDQMQYLGWIQSASRQVLVSDLFVVHSTPADYFQPLIAISGGLTALGVAAWLSLLLWKPVAVIAAFCAVRAYARRSLTGRPAQHAGLLIALFGGGLPAIGDLWPAFSSWGYPFALISIATMAGALLSYERAHAAGCGSVLAPALGALTSWLHPWQGEALALIVVGAELVMWSSTGRDPITRKRIALLATTVTATVLPLLYYVALAHLDRQWRIARVESKHAFALTTIIIALAPFLVAAAFAYRRRPRSFMAAATRVWPLAAIIVFLVSESGLSATPLHAFNGITVPLGVLSVEGVHAVGWRRIPGRFVLGPVLVAAATIPTTIDEMRAAADYVRPTPANANFIAPDERTALAFLARDPQPGGVLTRGYLGLITPAETGRHTYLGACQWSEPGCHEREMLVHRVFETIGISPRAVRAGVLGTDTRFVLNSTCKLPGKDLDKTLAVITKSVHHFGCATVYAIRLSGRSGRS